METRTHVPENQQQLIDSIQKCMQEGIMPIMQAGTHVGGSQFTRRRMVNRKTSGINKC